MSKKTSFAMFCEEVRGLHLPGSTIDGVEIGAEDLSRLSLRVLNKYSKMGYKTGTYEGNPVHFGLWGESLLKSETTKCRACKRARFGKDECECLTALKAFYSHHGLDLREITRECTYGSVVTDFAGAVRGEEAGIAGLTNLYQAFVDATIKTAPQMDKGQVVEHATDQLKQAIYMACARVKHRGCRMVDGSPTHDHERVTEDIVRIVTSVAQLVTVEVSLVDKAAGRLSGLFGRNTQKEPGRFHAALGFIKRPFVAVYGWCRQAMASSGKIIAGWGGWKTKVYHTYGFLSSFALTWVMTSAFGPGIGLVLALLIALTLNVVIIPHVVNKGVSLAKRAFAATFGRAKEAKDEMDLEGAIPAV